MEPRDRPGGARRERGFGLPQFAWDLLAGMAMALGFAAGAPTLGLLGAFEVFAISLTLFWAGGFMLADVVKVRMVRVLLAGAAVAAAFVAVVGWARLAGPWGLLVPAVVAVSWPRWSSTLRGPGTKRLWRGVVTGPEEPADSPAAVVASPSETTWQLPSDLDDEGLRRVWEASWAALRKAPTPADALFVVEFRGLCLDELERRNPAGFGEWLAAGAPHTRQPARHLPPRLMLRKATPDAE